MASVEDWVIKAEEDYHAVIALNRQRKYPVPDLVCYHCQQCAEKYLKAFLVKQNLTPPRIHDLITLLRQCVSYEASLQSHSQQAALLNQYIATTRYPGSIQATAADAQAAIVTLRQLRTGFRKELGL